MVSSNDFKNGMTILYEGNLYKILEFMHVKPGKGAAFVRTKLRNLRSGAIVDITFQNAERQMCHGNHLTHTLHTVFRDTIVQFSFVTHNRIHEYLCATGSLLPTVVGNHPCLAGRTDKSRGYRIEAESQLFPHWEDTFYIISGLQDIKLPVV